MNLSRITLVITLALLCVRSTVAQKPISIAVLNRKTPVHFQKEILPILQRNCLACHSASEPSGELVLESPQSMVKGGDTGPAIVPGNGAKSLLLKLASHNDDPAMPPLKNKVAAKALTPKELGLVKLWIDQGAKGKGLSGLLSPTQWRPLPAGNYPIYAVAVSPDGQFAACGRANQIFIYHVATGQVVTRLTDPALQKASTDKRPGISHLDVVQSLTFNRRGDRLASGGFRTVKLWRFPRDVQQQALTSRQVVKTVAVSPDRRWVAIGNGDNMIQLYSLEKIRKAKTPANAGQVLNGHTGEIRGLCFSSDSRQLISGGADKAILVWNTSDGKLVGRIDATAEVNSVATLMLPKPVTRGSAAKSREPREVIVSGGADKLVRLWNMPLSLPTKLANSPPATTVVAANAAGTLLAMANAKGVVRLVDSRTNKLLKQWQGPAVAIHDMAFGMSLKATPKSAAAKKDPTKSVRTGMLATASADGTVLVRNLENDKNSLLLRGSTAAIRSVAFRKDGKQLAAGDATGRITIWNTNVPSARRFKGVALPNSLTVISPDGKRLATTSQSKGRHSIAIRDLASGQVRQELLGHAAPIVALAFSSDGRKIVSGSADKTARVWDLSAAAVKAPEKARFAGHKGSVTAVAFSSNGGQVVSGASDNSVALWKVADGKLVKQFKGHTGPIVSVAVLANNQLVSASSDKTIRFWNPATGQAARTTSQPAAITAMTLSGNRGRLAVALADNSIKLYPSTGGAATHTLKGHTKTIQSLAFSTDNKRLISGSAGDSAIVWDAIQGHLLESVKPLGQPSPALTWATFGPTSELVVLNDKAGGISLQSLHFAAALVGIKKAVTSLAFHPAGQLILASSEDGTVRGFNIATARQTFSANHGAVIHDMAISKDGTRLATAGDNKVIRLWNATNGGQLQPNQLSGFTAAVRSVQFSADGTRVLGGGGIAKGELLVFHLANRAGVLEQSIRGHNSPVQNCVALGVRSRVFSVSKDGAILGWDLLGIRHIRGHSQSVTSVAAFPSLQSSQPPQIVSGSLDGTLRRWNAITGQQLAQLNHGGPITAIAVRGDGKRLASASSNKTVKLWNATNNRQLPEMRGDIRAKNLLANLKQRKSNLTVKITAAKATLTAVNKTVPVKATAEKAAATALAAANKDVSTKSTAFAKATTTKTNAEKIAIERAAAAQQADKVKSQANQRALDLAAVARLLNEKAGRARAAASVDATNKALAKIAADATAAAAAADKATKAAEAAKAAPTKAASDSSKAAASAAQKALATNKPFNDASTALTASQRKQRSVKQAHEFAVRDLKQAKDAVPKAKQALAKAEALLKQVEARLAQAVKAEAAAQQPVHSIAFSPDGRTLASGGGFGVVHTWNAENGRAVSSYVGHKGAIHGVRFVTNDALVSISADKKTIFWNLNPSWRLERVIGNIADPGVIVDRVVSVDFNKDGTKLATAGGVPSRSGEVKIWNVADGKLLQAIPDAHTDAVNGVAFSPDGLYVASASSDKYLKKFSVATGKLVAQFEGHTNHVLSVSWQAGGKRLASCGADATIRLWNADTGDRIRVIRGFRKQVSAVRFIGQTRFFLTSTGDPFVRKYNSDNGGVQSRYNGSADYMYSIDGTADPNNGVVVAGGHDGVLRIWRSNGPVIHSIAAPQSAVAKAKQAGP